MIEIIIVAPPKLTFLHKFPAFISNVRSGFVGDDAVVPMCPPLLCTHTIARGTPSMLLITRDSRFFDRHTLVGSLEFSTLNPWHWTGGHLIGTPGSGLLSALLCSESLCWGFVLGRLCRAIIPPPGHSPR